MTVKSDLKITKTIEERQEMAAKKWRKESKHFNYRTFYQLNSDSVIFDLGGYKGDWTSLIIDRYDCNAFVFEPVEKFSSLISERFKNNPKVKSFCFGLEGKTTEDTIAIDEDASSVFFDTSTGAKENIKFVEAKKFIVDYKIGQVDIIKINIEGGEYELLEHSIKEGLITKFNNIQVQFHYIPQIDSDNRLKNIQEQLSKTHKVTWKFRPYIWENWKLK